MTGPKNSSAYILKDLKANLRNPRTISKWQQDALKKSLVKFGDLSGIVFNRRTGQLVGGHQRIDLFREQQGDEKIIIAKRTEAPDEYGTVAIGWVNLGGARHAYREVDWDAITEKAANIAANQHGGEFADDALAQILKGLDGHMDMDLTGFADNERIDLLAALNNGNGDPSLQRDEQIEPTIELQKKWGTATGQIWALGRHRLLCGDATGREGVLRLLGNAKPNLMVTDPPYGVNYDPQRARRFRGMSILRSGRVMNDDMADWSAAFKLFPGNVVYCWFGDVNWPIVARSLQEWRLRCVIVWAKPNLVMSRGDYHWQHEQCWYGVRIGCRSMRTADRTQSTLWQISASGECGHGHGTEKPIECMARPIRNHAINEIYDPFLGSGTTMIASERLGRRCFGVEIHPPYVAVALERMHIAFPGMRIVLTGD